jgi:hypothetical protein
MLSLATGKEKEAARGQSENSAVAVSATAYTTKEQIDGLLGSDMGGFYTVVQITVTPKAGSLKIDIDDFLLRSFKDGQKSNPLTAGEIAGSADIVVHEVKVGPRGPGADNGGTVYSPGGMASGVGVGSPGSSATQNTISAAPKPQGKGKPNPMLDVLKQKILAKQETDKPVSGLLIFPLEKQRPKDLELVYHTPAGPIKVSFR